MSREVLTIERDLLVDEHPLSKFKLLELTDRGGLKYPSKVVLESIVTAWRIYIHSLAKSVRTPLNIHALIVPFID